jgi:hypothetical protein
MTWCPQRVEVVNVDNLAEMVQAKVKGVSSMRSEGEAPIDHQTLDKTMKVIVTSYLSVMNDGRTVAEVLPMGHPVVTIMSGSQAMVLATEAGPEMNCGVSLEQAMPKIMEWVAVHLLNQQGIHPEDAAFFRLEAGRVFKHPLEQDDAATPENLHASQPVDESELSHIAASMGMTLGVINSAMEEARRKAESFAQSRTARGKAVLTRIKRTWPELFEPRPLPFKIGIDAEIKAELDHLRPEDVSRALQMHCNSMAYKRALCEGTSRFGLDGKPDGVVMTT